MCIKLGMISKLTLKQRKFWKHYQKSHHLAESAKAAGSKGKDLKSLSEIGSQILESFGLSMPELLNAQGLTDEALSQPLKDGIQAQKVIVATWEGKITDRIDVEDHPTRLKAVELIGRMKGVFQDKINLSGRDGGDIILQVKVLPGKKGPKSIDLDID